MEHLHIAALVCVCFVGVFQISETAPSGCVKERTPCDDHRNCTPGVTACLKRNNDPFTACYPCRCRNPNQCHMVNDKATCVCDPTLTGDHCECPLYRGEVNPPPEVQPPEGPHEFEPLQACPTDWIQRNTYCYFLKTDDLKTWSEAKEYCEMTFPATLLKVDDANELRYIGQLVEDTGKELFALFTGGHYSNDNNDWRWPDDSVIDSSLLDPNTENYADCIQYGVFDKSLSPNSCEDPLPFICKMQAILFK